MWPERRTDTVVSDVLHVRLEPSVRGRMRSGRPPLFGKRQLEPVIIVTCVRWYLRLPLSARNVERSIAEHGFEFETL